MILDETQANTANLRIDEREKCTSSPPAKAERCVDDGRSKSAHEHDPLHQRAVGGNATDDVHTRGHGSTGAIRAVPGHRVASGTPHLVDEPSNDTSPNIVDGQGHPLFTRQAPGNSRRFMEWIRCSPLCHRIRHRREVVFRVAPERGVLSPAAGLGASRELEKSKPMVYPAPTARSSNNSRPGPASGTHRVAGNQDNESRRPSAPSQSGRGVATASLPRTSRTGPLAPRL